MSAAENPAAPDARAVEAPALVHRLVSISVAHGHTGRHGPTVEAAQAAVLAVLRDRDAELARLRGEVARLRAEADPDALTIVRAQAAADLQGRLDALRAEVAKAMAMVRHNYEAEQRALTLLAAERARGDRLRIALAWRLYCEETAGGADVRDFWRELAPNVQQIYLAKADALAEEARRD